MAKKYVKIYHIDKFFSQAVGPYNHRVSGVKSKGSKSKYFAYRALEI